MSIDFSKLTGWSTSKGAVTQVADSSGRVIWKLETSKPVILEVEKITSDTYAGETTYTGEQFILLDIYPKTNGTVSVTYGGLTKTITDTSGAEEPNAQQVFFGTFNGVSDGVETPASGELTIEGDYYAFGVGGFDTNSKGIKNYRPQITDIIAFGIVKVLPWGAFNGQTKITDVTIPDSVIDIGGASFQNCNSLSNAIIGNSVESIGSNAFYSCKALKAIEIPSGVKTIGHYAFGFSALETATVFATMPPTLTSGTDANDNVVYAFHNCSNLTSIIVPKGSGNAYKTAEGWSTYADYIVEAS